MAAVKIYEMTLKVQCVNDFFLYFPLYRNNLESIHILKKMIAGSMQHGLSIEYDNNAGRNFLFHSSKIYYASFKTLKQEEDRASKQDGEIFIL